MSLYLKYRPTDFNNLVWQVFVKETLQKAINDKKTVWAYLLCWPRWTWKTSTARILAKAVNCKNIQNWNPCLECEICKNFHDDKLVDIIEIDAASHTWVDNIREIIEKAQFSPSKTKYKIYIIDEVHMLSKWAFNALLKILEEPPNHVKFILATTETHKVPETIISRCQRYDFKRISSDDLNLRLQYIAKSEKVKIDSDSLNYIIKNSSGWLRNAISLFEQLISDWEIKYVDIVKKLEIVNEEIIDNFLEKLLHKDKEVINIYEKVIADWKNVKLFFKELLFYTKNKSLKLLSEGNKIWKYIEILEILDDTYTKTKNSLDENTTFLIWILKIINWVSWESKNEKINIKKETSNNLSKEKNIEIKKEENIEISSEDLNDIFWDNESNKQEKNIKENITKNFENQVSNFDSDNFINKLKENWWKWWLTMALRGALLEINQNSLIIWVKTKIAKWQVENPDNLNLISKTLNDIWYVDYNIKTK